MPVYLCPCRYSTCGSASPSLYGVFPFQKFYISITAWKRKTGVIFIRCRDLNPGPTSEKQMTYQCATVLLNDDDITACFLTFDVKRGKNANKVCPANSAHSSCLLVEIHNRDTLKAIKPFRVSIYFFNSHRVVSCFLMA